MEDTAKDESPSWKASNDLVNATLRKDPLEAEERYRLACQLRDMICTPGSTTFQLAISVDRVFGCMIRAFQEKEGGRWICLQVTYSNDDGSGYTFFRLPDFGSLRTGSCTPPRSGTKTVKISIIMVPYIEKKQLDVLSFRMVGSSTCIPETPNVIRCSVTAKDLQYMCV